jgi:DNA-binding NarL/FixJ family response regulator
VNRPRVLLADDHRVVTEGLKGVLADEFEVVSEIPEPLPPVAGPVLK